VKNLNVLVFIAFVLRLIKYVKDAAVLIVKMINMIVNIDKTKLIYWRKVNQIYFNELFNHKNMVKVVIAKNHHVERNIVNVFKQE
jgi:hypothetical protein